MVLQRLLLGLAGALLQPASDSVWGVAASGARAWSGRSPRRLSLLGGTGGLAMIGLGSPSPSPAVRTSRRPARPAGRTAGRPGPPERAGATGGRRLSP
ncbi:hypothetical protein HOY81_03495 [Streptomyces sp. JJ36]|nr:hypothetical protein [Streptomyces sp. JJ36]